VRARLLGAAALCALSLGVAWSYNAGSAGYSMGGYEYQYHYSSYEEGYVNELTFVPGLYYMPGQGSTYFPGRSSDVRVVLIPAVVALAWAADARRRHARTAARWAVGGLAFCVGLALSRGMSSAALVTSAAIVAAWPATGFRLRRWFGSGWVGPVPAVARTGSG
jgi:hypothetical protein